MLAYCSDGRFAKKKTIGFGDVNDWIRFSTAVLSLLILIELICEAHNLPILRLVISLNTKK